MLLDTSGLLCFFDADEARHPRAISLYDASPRRVTHNYILSEFVALTSARRLPRKESIGFVSAIALDPDVELHWVDPVLHNEALDLLATQLDKSYSLCDAVSFLLMQRLGMLDALSTDHHFEQAGFRCLLV